MSLTGEHAFSGCYGRDLFSPGHDDICAAIRAALRSIPLLRVHPMPPNLLAHGYETVTPPTPADAGRLGDVLITHRETRKRWLLEIKTLTSMAHLHTGLVFSVPGHAVGRRVEAARKDYSRFVFNANFYPLIVLAFDSYSAVSATFSRFSSEMGRIQYPGIVGRDGQPVDLDGLYSRFVRRFRERIAVAWALGVAAQLQHWLQLCTEAAAVNAPAPAPVAFGLNVDEELILGA
ncbi:hypothetical protein DFJ74DRAFT_756263 [Hyaloraphidium curvatum]|nr:hypothetical protein DFJ74DRAFT_756263 [Hyaloraphidium curvatum]